MFVLAHLSDPHIGPLPSAPVSAFANKRFFGRLSWNRRRRWIHRPEILAALVSDLKAQTPDHIAVTGDLTNVALEAEFLQARDWLRELGAPDLVSVVPGNHDAYVRVPWEASLEHWRPFMTSDPDLGCGGASVTEAHGFPYVRKRGPIVLIGLSTAHPTPPFCAYGTLGSDQLDRLAQCLQTFGQKDWFRVVLLHHPPLPDPTNWRKRLMDAGGFQRVVIEHGAELVLHGHDHLLQVDRIDGGVRSVPVFGVPSASATQSHRKPAAHYRLHSIDRDGGTWRIRTVDRGVDPTTGTFRETGTQEMRI